MDTRQEHILDGTLVRYIAPCTHTRYPIHLYTPTGNLELWEGNTTIPSASLLDFKDIYFQTFRPKYNYHSWLVHRNPGLRWSRRKAHTSDFCTLNLIRSVKKKKAIKKKPTMSIRFATVRMSPIFNHWFIIKLGNSWSRSRFICRWNSKKKDLPWRRHLHSTRLLALLWIWWWDKSWAFQYELRHWHTVHWPLKTNKQTNKKLILDIFLHHKQFNRHGFYIIWIDPLNVSEHVYVLK